jgi:hypothetical protein
MPPISATGAAADALILAEMNLEHPTLSIEHSSKIRDL